ncbi:MAG: hypothetical protein WBA16_06090 [Nonlabens sp.]
MKKISIVLLLLAVVPLSHAQKYTWARRGGGNANFLVRTPSNFEESEHLRDIRIDSRGNRYYLAIMGGDAADLDGAPIDIYEIPRAGEDILLFSTDCGGNFRWSKTIGSVGPSTVQSISIDAWDNIYLSGFVASRASSADPFVHFGNDVVVTTTPGVNDPGPHNKTIFLAKYDSNGVLQWLNRPQRDNADLDNDIRNTLSFAHHTESDGTTHWIVQLGPGTHVGRALTVAAPSIFLLRFNAAGGYLGYLPLNLGFPNGTFPRYSIQLVVDEVLDRYYISAYINNRSSSISLDGVVLDAAMVVAALDMATGATLLSHANTGGKNGTRALELLVDDQSNLYIAGRSNSSTSNGNVASLAGHVFT